MVRIVMKFKNEPRVSILFLRFLIFPLELTFLGHIKHGESQGPLNGVRLELGLKTPLN